MGGDEMRYKKVYWIVFLTAIGLVLFAACTPTTTTYDPMGQASMMGTNAANTGAIAQATIDAATRAAQIHIDSITSTAVSVAETRTAEGAATTTAIAVKIADVEIARLEQEMQQDLEMTRVFAQVTVDAISTNQAVALDASNLQLTRVALENQRVEADIAVKKAHQTFYKALPWLVVLAVVLAAIAAFYWKIRQDSPKQVIIPGGTPMVLIRTPENGWQPLNESQPQLPEGNRPQLPGAYINQRALPAQVPRRDNNNGSLSARAHTPGKPVYLPDRIPAGQIALGMSATRQLMYPFNDLKDMMVAGEKGSGKSSFLQMLAYQAVRHRWEVYLMDAEQITFDPSVWGPVAQTEQEVIGLLEFLLYEMFEYRFALYREAGEKIREAFNHGRLADPFRVENVDAYNKAADMFGMRRLSPCMLIWDEASSSFGNRRVVDLLHEYIRRNRKPGVATVLASQSWYSSGPSGLSGVIKQRLERRIAFRTDEKTSQIVVGNPAAALITADMKGHAISREDGRIGRLQTFYLPDRQLFQHISPIKTENSPDHIWEPGMPPHKNGDNATPAPPQINMTGGKFTITGQTGQDDVQDAAWLLNQPPASFESRRQVATALTGGLDNGYAYGRAHAALRVLCKSDNEDWAELAQGLLATIPEPEEAVR